MDRKVELRDNEEEIEEGERGTLGTILTNPRSATGW